jgi:hypothetical protein
MRTPGDLVFILAGPLPLVWGLWVSYRDLWRRGVGTLAANTAR